MTYLFVGENSAGQQAQIAQLKAQWASDPDALQFDYQVLYGQKLEPKELKKAFLALPAIHQQRLVYLRQAEKLDEHCKKILLEFLLSKPHHLVLVLEAVALPASDEIWKQIRALSQTHEAKKSVKENVFDMAKLMTLGKGSQALQSLYQLYEEGAHPLQILGGVVWAWGNHRSRVSPEDFQTGLLALQEADLSIKRSRLDPQEAVEILVVKLAGLSQGISKR